MALCTHAVVVYCQTNTTHLSYEYHISYSEGSNAQGLITGTTFVQPVTCQVARQGTPP